MRTLKALPLDHFVVIKYFEHRSSILEHGLCDVVLKSCLFSYFG